MAQLARPVRVACVGLGRMGKIRAEALAAQGAAELAWVVDASAELAKDWAGRYGSRWTDRVDEAVRDASVDAVWIAAPTHAHEELIQVALAHGKAVGVEKPVCATPQAAAACYDAAEAAGLPLFCSFQRRFDPAYVAVAQRVANGDVGTVKKIHTIFRDHPCPPMEFLRTGGDPFHDLLVHDLDYVMGEILRIRRPEQLPTRILGTGTSFLPELRQEGIMDTASMLLEFPSGIVVTMEADRFAPYGYDQRCEVFGTQGMAQVNNPAQAAHVVAGSDGFHADRLHHSFPERFFNTYRDEIEAFLATAAGHAPAAVTRTDVLYSSLVAEAGRLSALHSTVVTPSIDPNTGAFLFARADGRLLDPADEVKQ